MDYAKMETELADLIKSMLSQARLQVTVSQARAYSLEIAQVASALKTVKETAILDAQLVSMVPRKE